MILRSIELESFGKFRGQTVEFRRGMNIVIGPNEAGKSTIAEAVPAVLFGTDRLERFKPWGRNACVATLFFEGHGHTIKVKRNLITDEVELVEKDDLYHVKSQFSGKAPLRGRSASCREYRSLLEKLIGVADERLFRATYFFGHHPQAWTGDELALKLRTLVGGAAETDYAEVVDTMLDEHFQLTRSNPWGRDKQRDREYEEICQQMASQGVEDSVPVFVEMDQSTDAEEEIRTLSDELDFERQEYEKGVRYIERFRMEAELKEAESSPVKEREEPVEIKSVTKSTFPEKLAAVGLPKSPPRQLPELLEEAADIRQTLAVLQQPYATIAAREKKVPNVPWLAVASLFALFVAVSVGAWFLGYFVPQLSIGSGVCCVALLVWAGWRHKAREKALAECLKERKQLDLKKIAAQQRQAELSERCETFGLPSSAIDLVRLQKLVTKHRRLLEEYWGSTKESLEVEPIVDDLQGKEKLQSICTDEVVDEDSGDIVSEAVLELQQMEARMSEFAEKIKEKESQLKELISKRDSLSSEQKNAMQGPVEQEISVNDPARALFRRKQRLEERIAVLRKALNLLAEAVDEFGRSHLVRLNSEASKMFGKITAGRYPTLKLDENMSPSVQVDGRRWVPVDHFSRGTVDAIYLALRIGLAKVRDDGRSLPLMLDDPFVHLDQKRLAKTLNLVDMASADGQLILFSHNLDLGKRAAKDRWHVVPIDGNTVETNAEEGEDHVGQLHLL